MMERQKGMFCSVMEIWVITVLPVVSPMFLGCVQRLTQAAGCVIEYERKPMGLPRM
jgi:hypothetical protein